MKSDWATKTIKPHIHTSSLTPTNEMNPEQLETAYKLLLLMENDIKACTEAEQFGDWHNNLNAHVAKSYDET